MLYFNTSVNQLVCFYNTLSCASISSDTEYRLFYYWFASNSKNSNKFSNWIKRTEISECAHKFIQEISLHSQIISNRDDCDLWLNEWFEV